MFETLQSRLVVRGRLRVETAVRIGAGRAAPSADTDLPVMRDAQGMPFIPGSSLKGAMRGWVEAFLRSMADSPQKMRRLACDPLAVGSVGGGPVSHAEGRAAFDYELGICVEPREVSEWQRRPDDQADHFCKARKVEGFDRPLGDDEVVQVLRKRLCCACRLFGHQALASPILFADLPPVSGDPLRMVAIRDGVAIDRDTGTVSGGRKYDYEVVQGGAEFELEIVAENLEPWQRGLLLLGVLGLSAGQIKIGGAKSRGLGAVRLVGTNGDPEPEILWYEPTDLEAKIDMAVGRLAGTRVDPRGDVAGSWLEELRTEIQRRLSGQRREA
jgi:CRISPR-associated RAMP protein (TIGR02581 family)